MVETRPRSSQLRTLNESSALRFWRSERRQRRFAEPTALAAPCCDANEPMGDSPGY